VTEIPTAGPARVQCVGGIITDDSGRLLLILRGHEPGKGLWSIPGGRIESGETDAQALAREMLEETGLIVTCGPLLGTVERPGLGGAVIEIRDYRAIVTGGELMPGDDADDARWVTGAEAAQMDATGQLTGSLLETLRGWSVLGS
jgi:8-oxo-dGTP diphosphatase